MFESAVLVACTGRFATDRSFHTMFERLTDAALAAPAMGGITR
jgi:hypothetical protein